MKFSEAMKLLEDGFAVKRKDWEGYIIIWEGKTCTFIAWINPTVNYGGQEPHAIELPNRDMLAEDWEYYEI